LKDCLNREIQEGSYIAYALSVYRTTRLRLYKVIEVHPSCVVAANFLGFDKDGTPKYKTSVQLSDGDRALMVHPSELDSLKS
jgi:hypothetical protein